MNNSINAQTANCIPQKWTIDFVTSKILTDHYVRLWNFNRKRTEQIDESVLEYYYYLIRIARHQFFNKQKIYDKDLNRKKI
jgi:hypothetical protein